MPLVPTGSIVAGAHAA
ncbi:hypothetical protein, partial [Streptomyces albus]